MNSFLIDGVAGPDAGGFAGIGKIDLGNWFWGGGFGVIAIFLFTAAAKGGF